MAAATNGGAKSKTLFTPSVIVVFLSHALQPRGLSLRGRDWHDVVIFTGFHRRVFAAVLAVAGDFVLRSGCCEVERVVQDPSNGSPFTDLALPAVFGEILNIPILADVVHGKAGIESSQL